MTRYSESTIRYIKDMVKEGKLQEAWDTATDSGKYSEDEAKSFILQNESELKNGRAEKRSDN